ncbi:uncharacterized abhydrolase domain-containing protein DDB_G0269086 isoform X2 [Osmerus eperlanus]
MSKMETLQRMLSHTTLSTQRALHTHILDLGEKYRSQSSTSSRQAPRLPAPAPHAEQGEVGDTLEEDVWMEVFLRRAEEEREEALRLQEERLQARFKAALRARERLEAEQRQGERVERQARFEERWAGSRAELEREMRLTLEKTRERLRAEMRREAEQERQREIEAMDARAKEAMRRSARGAEECVRQQCEREAQRDRMSLQDKHAVELSHMQSRIGQLEERLATVTRERMRYECEFKKVQCSYRQFVDLTDSSLHSDYLLRLRRLGREPGYTETGAQTDDVITTGNTLPPEVKPDS